MKKISRKKIVIIGAGIAGLTCARDLSKYNKNLDILILEASDSLGGRVKSIKANDGTTIEMGAQYIHGTIGNPIFDYAVEKGIIKPDVHKEFKPYKIAHFFHKEVEQVCSGQKLNKARQMGLEYQQKILDELLRFNDKEISVYDSIGDYLLKRYQEKLNEYSSDKEFQTALKSVFVWAANAEALTNGCSSLFNLDIKGFIDFVDLEGDLCYVFNDNAIKYNDIAQSIFNEIEIKDEKSREEFIKFNHVVNDIEFSDNDDIIKISCENEEIFHANFVIITISIEVLKRFIREKKIKPCIANEKIHSIEKLVLGKVTKLFVKFENPVDPEINYIHIYPSHKSFDEFKDFEKKNYLDCNKNIYTTDTFDRINGSDWWLTWLNADMTKEITNTNKKLFVENLFKDLNVNYPNLDLKIDSTLFYASDWTTNQYFEGSYSYLNVGASNRDIFMLSKPIFYSDMSALLFAGEMTQQRFYSTVHGAYLSGVREAKRLIDLLQSDDVAQ